MEVVENSNNGSPVLPALNTESLDIPDKKSKAVLSSPETPDSTFEDYDVLSPASGRLQRTPSALYRLSKEERYAREVNAMMAWANSFLKPRGFELKILSQDFRDGVLMINLLEACFHEKVASNYNLRPKLDVQRLDNYSLILQFLKKKRVHILSIDIHDLVSGKENVILVLLLNIMRRVTLNGLSSAGVENAPVELSAATRRRASSSGNMSIRKMLRDWANGILSKNKDIFIEISDFWESFKDGMALTVLVDSLVPGKINIQEMMSASPAERLQTAFEVAESGLGIPTSLKAEDITLNKDSDEKSIENYLCMLISAQKAAQKRDQSRKKTSSADEVKRLSTALEENKSQFQSLQKDYAALFEKYQQIISSNSLNPDSIAKKSLADAAREHEKINELLNKQREMSEQIHELSEKLVATETELEETKNSKVNIHAEFYRAYREYEDVLNNLSEKMNLKVLERKYVDRPGNFEDLVEQSILEQKTFEDFMKSLTTREGWLLKVPNDDKRILSGTKKPKKRWFQLKQNILYMYKEKHSKTHEESFNLKFYKRIKINGDGSPFDDSQFDASATRRGSIVIQAKSFIKLEPDLSIKNNVSKPIVLAPVPSLAAEVSQDILLWGRDINDRISLIRYLTDMFEKVTEHGRVQGCRELVDLISNVDANLLKIEHKVPMDLTNALVHFQESLITRHGLSISLVNTGSPDSICDLVSTIVAMNHTMKSVILTNNLITDRGAIAFAEALSKNRNLLEVDLSGNQISDEGLIALSKAFLDHNGLEEFVLASNKITAEGVKSFVENSLKYQERFRRVRRFPLINFSGNQINDDGLIAICQLLEQNDTIKTLNLSHNMITDSGVTALANVLKKNCSLRTIILSNNQITSRGASALAESIASSKSPITFDLSFNHLIGRKGFGSFFSIERPLQMDMFRITVNVVDQDSVTGV